MTPIMTFGPVTDPITSFSCTRKSCCHVMSRSGTSLLSLRRHIGDTIHGPGETNSSSSSSSSSGGDSSSSHSGSGSGGNTLCLKKRIPDIINCYLKKDY